jgi:3-dehydroquinate synthase
MVRPRSEPLQSRRSGRLLLVLGAAIGRSSAGFFDRCGNLLVAVDRVMRLKAPMSQLPNHAVTVPVVLGARSYDVLIGAGLFGNAAAMVESRFPGARVTIVTDEHVAKHYLADLVASFGTRCLGSVVMPAGEATKNFANLGLVAERLLETGLERGDFVVALGGGVIGDLAGFAASIIRRGVRFIQIPTSLLAQVDSSVGGKTGINTAQGKNLVGAFHQPSLVLADTDLLSTLPVRQLRAGYAEVIKYGLLGDPAFFDRLEKKWLGLFGNDLSELSNAIATSVRAKAAIVARDETEVGDRMLLNLGHTFGHALEAWAGYSDRLLHGEAVAIGMAQAFRFSEGRGLMSDGTAARVEAHLRAVGLPTRVGDIAGPDRPDVATLVRLMGQDKKVHRGQLTFILVRGIGHAFVARDVGNDELCAFLEQELS